MKSCSSCARSATRDLTAGHVDLELVDLHLEAHEHDAAQVHVLLGHLVGGEAGQRARLELGEARG